MTLKNPSIAPIYPLMGCTNDTQHTTPLKKRYFIQDNDNPHPQDAKPLVSETQSHIITTTPNTLKAGPSDDLHQTPATCSVPDVRDVSDYMNIPNLWNVEIECGDDGAAAEAVDVDEAEMNSFGSDTSFEIVDL